MRAQVVYESMFGNTQAVADAVARGIETRMSVQTSEVGAAPALDDVAADLLVVGAPTHAFGMSRASTRQDAVHRSGRAVISDRTGVREWLEGASPTHRRVATFDTHVKRPNLPGSASRAVEKRLRRLGCEPVVEAETFYVDGLEGPLLAGEIARAEQWGASLAARTVSGAANARG